MKDITIGVVGNPNCGKTTLFNALTGTKQRVGNWPGVTVDRKSGEYTHDGKRIEVVDLPGIYSLSATSLDEEVARDYILSGEPDLIVNIVDASNIERNLYLTVQLLEMQIPLVLALNMMDMAKNLGIQINIPALAERLGCPVVPLVASKGKGVDELRSEINRAAGAGSVSQLGVLYPQEIQEAVNALADAIRDEGLQNRMNPRWAGVKLLEGDPWVSGFVSQDVREKADSYLTRIEDRLGEEADILVADSRYDLIGRLTRDTIKRGSRASRTLSDNIDRIVLNRYLGIPIFLVAMYLMFMVTINLGGAFIDFFDIFTGTIFVDGFGALLGALGAPDWLTAVLAGGVGGGIQTIATFIPPIGFMFLCLCLLEDSGYMARAAFVMDRFMRMIGLPGKSFVPMLVGFGCNVPAVMATRTLENQRDRTLTIMMQPFMSCGARLPVYALFAAAFFPVGGQNLVFGLYLLGIGFAVLTGLVLKTTLLKGEITPFVMELPPYHLPTLRGVVLSAWDRLKTFMFRAGKIIIPVVAVLSFLNSLGTDGAFGNEDREKSTLSFIGKSITPVFNPMGLTEADWPATVGIFTGIFAKEAVVGTLDALYNQIGFNAAEETESKKGFDFWGGVKDSFATIPANLIGVADTVFDPLGLSIGDVSSLEGAAQEQEVSGGTFGSMVRLFDGRIGAFAYLLFVLLYFPCVAAIAAVYRETNIRWTAFVGAWTTGLAYLASTMFYQAATMARHPISSVAWIVVLCTLFAGVVLTMRYMGNRRRRLETGRFDGVRTKMSPRTI
ncbi:MAG: Fe(2+) transporter permease subunit FeoB [Deltaproteobacteria bacterium]|nr:Fe(2+) transporter permease subunit FeoB [Deltaproteobacteria bacterium]